MSAQPARAYFGIGEVLARLRGEFPDVSVSKIRFLESEGLIEPARSPSGYRRFHDGDVERLRYILTAQRDEYLPLRVIRERLVLPGDGSPAAGASGPSAPMTRRELAGAAGIDDEQLAELETFGLVRRAGRMYPPEALQIASAAADLGRHGFGARHLRAVRAAAERESALIEQQVAPVLHQRSPGARTQAAQTARDIAAAMLRLHGALISAALAEAGFPAGSGTGPAPGGQAGGAASGGPAVSAYRGETA